MNDSCPVGAASHYNNYGTKRPKKASASPDFQKRDTSGYEYSYLKGNGSHGRTNYEHTKPHQATELSSNQGN